MQKHPTWSLTEIMKYAEDQKYISFLRQYQLSLKRRLRKPAHWKRRLVLNVRHLFGMAEAQAKFQKNLQALQKRVRILNTNIIEYLDIQNQIMRIRPEDVNTDKFQKHYRLAVGHDIAAMKEDKNTSVCLTKNYAYDAKGDFLPKDNILIAQHILEDIKGNVERRIAFAKECQQSITKSLATANVTRNWPWITCLLNLEKWLLNFNGVRVLTVGLMTANCSTPLKICCYDPPKTLFSKVCEMQKYCERFHTKAFVKHFIVATEQLSFAVVHVGNVQKICNYWFLGYNKKQEWNIFQDYHKDIKLSDNDDSSWAMPFNNAKQSQKNTSVANYVIGATSKKCSLFMKK